MWELKTTWCIILLCELNTQWQTELELSRAESRWEKRLSGSGTFNELGLRVGLQRTAWHKHTAARVFCGASIQTKANRKI